MRGLAGGLVALAVLAACQPAGTGVAPKRSTGPGGVAETAAPGTAIASSSAPTNTTSLAPAAGGSPTASGSPAASPAPVALAEPRKLQKLEGATSVLTGVATLDAGYLVATGGGNVISHNGSAIVATGGGNFISGNGGAIVATGGGNFISGNGAAVVAQGGGNFISGNGAAMTGGNGGATIVAQGGGNVIADGGLNLVAQGGGNLVAQGGGNLVAQGGGNLALLSGPASYRAPWPAFQVLQAEASAAASPPPVAIGTLLPAVGLRISVLTLDTNTPVPVGRDPDGKPVYTVYTNAEGKYELYLPPEMEGNVRVVANVRALPGASNPLQDPNPRFRYDVISPVGTGKDQPLDEDTQVVSQFLMSGFTAKFYRIISSKEAASDLVDEIFNNANLSRGQPAVVQTMLVKMIKELNDTGVKEANLDKAPPAYIEEVARRVGLLVLEKVRFQEIELDATSTIWYESATREPAFKAMVEIFGRLRDHSKFFLAERPGYFERQSYFLDPLCQGRLPKDFRILKPSDLGTLLVEGYLKHEDNFWPEIGDALESVGANDLPEHLYVAGRHQHDRLNAATFAIIIQIAIVCGTDEEVREAAKDLLRASKYTGPAVTSTPTPAPMCAP